MKDKEMLEYVKTIIINNLHKSGHTNEVATIIADDTNKILLQHIKGLKSVLLAVENMIEKGGV